MKHGEDGEAVILQDFPQILGMVLDLLGILTENSE